MATDTLGTLFYIVDCVTFLTLLFLASYGSLARFRDLRRIRTVGKNSIVGASGEYSDFQYIMHDLDDLV